MTAIRAFFRRHVAFGLLIVLLAIGLRAVMPAGYMTSASKSGLTVELCSGVAGQTMDIVLPGAHHSDDGKVDKGHADSPCAFSGLSFGALSAIDPFILAIAIAFAMAAIFRPLAATVAASPAFLRPPPQGPPTLA